VRKTILFFNSKFRSFLLIVILCVAIINLSGKGFIDFKEFDNKILLIGKNATLSIIKAPVSIELKDTEREYTYTIIRNMNMMLESQWHGLKKVKKTLKVSDSLFKIEILLSNNSKSIMTIEYINENVFDINIFADDKKVDRIKGKNYLRDKEQIYGFGEMWNGDLAQKDNIIKIWDQNGTPDECAYMPYYVSTNNYAFFLNYGGLVEFDVGKSNKNSIFYESPASKFTFTLATGNSIQDVVKNFFDVIGNPSLPPRWTFEPWFWILPPRVPGLKPWQDVRVWGYNGKNTVDAALKFRELNIPVSATWFEPKWQSSRNNFTPNPEFYKGFGSFHNLIDSLNNLGIEVCAWIGPYTTPVASNWKEAVENNYIVRKPDGTIENRGKEVETGYYYIDFFNPEAVKWWQEQIEKALNYGLKGFKLDAGQKLPVDARLYGGRLGKDVHNSYALHYNKTFYDKLSSRYGQDFLMVPRSAWVGSGKYTNFKWPGDLSCSFRENGLPANVYSALSLSFCGIPFISSDIGGFDGRPPEEKVYVRWAQFGTFLPGMQTLHLPWWYTDETVEYYRYLSWLHTELVPLWMSLAYEAHKNALPICRPLVMSFQKDTTSWLINDEYMVGEAFLVAPMVDGKDSRDVYLPEGKWYYFFDDSKTYKGKESIRWKGGLWEFPLFIKEGAIIPFEVKNDITGLGWGESDGYLTIAIYPKDSGKSNFALHDKGDSVKFNAIKSGNEIKISWDNFVSDYLFRIHITEDSISDVKYNGESVDNCKDMMIFRKKNSAVWAMDKNKDKLWIRILANSQYKDNIITIVK
jgi:alpha-D-xyloside xylohydrolase